MRILSFLILLLVAGCMGQSCPSTAYTYCAGDRVDGGNPTEPIFCKIPGEIQSGYISHGLNGAFQLTPFTNHNGGTMSIACDYRLGAWDFVYNRVCCYIEEDFIDEFTNSQFTTWQQIGTGSETCTAKYRFTGSGSRVEAMRYGANDQYLYKLWSYWGYPECSLSFSDPVPGVAKTSAISYIIPPGLPTFESEWRSCANNAQWCGGLDKSSSYWVRFGNSNNGGTYYYQLVTGTSAVPCVQAFFRGTPTTGDMFCSVTGPIVTFSRIMGYWEQVAICGGGCGKEQSITKGISKSSSTALSSGYTESLEKSVTVTAGFSKGPVSAGVSGTLSESTSSSVTSSQVATVDKSMETTITVACTDNTDQAMYRYVTFAEENSPLDGMSDISISSGSYWCVSDDGMTPQCPPGTCAQGDVDCQTCDPGTFNDIAGLPIEKGQMLQIVKNVDVIDNPDDWKNVGVDIPDEKYFGVIDNPDDLKNVGVIDNPDDYVKVVFNMSYLQLYVGLVLSLSLMANVYFICSRCKNGKNSKFFYKTVSVQSDTDLSDLESANLKS